MKNHYGILLLVSLAVVAAQPALQQEPELAVSLSRDFGYGGFDNRIEGLFTIRAEGPEDLVRVDFYIDSESINSDANAPFAYQFTTNDFAPGEHRLYAIGSTSSDTQVRSNELIRVFLTPEQAGGAVYEVVVPILAIALAAIALTAVVPMLLNRGKRPVLGQYGALGAAVCPKCGLPSSYNFLAPNMVVGKLQRCPHCGKWSIMRRASPAELAAAEALWRRQESGSGAAQPDDEANRQRRQIDDSRYEK